MGIFFSVAEWFLFLFFVEEESINYSTILRINSIPYSIYIITIVLDLLTLPYQSMLLSTNKVSKFVWYNTNMVRYGKLIENLVISAYYLVLRKITETETSKVVVCSILP